MNNCDKCTHYCVCHRREVSQEPGFGCVDFTEKLCLKIGDTVYIVGHRFPAEITGVHITKKGTFLEWAEYKQSNGFNLGEWDNGEFSVEEVGKTVFSSQDEAQQKEVAIGWKKPSMRQIEFAQEIRDLTDVPIPKEFSAAAYWQYISDNVDAYNRKMDDCRRKQEQTNARFQGRPINYYFARAMLMNELQI